MGEFTRRQAVDGGCGADRNREHDHSIPQLPSPHRNEFFSPANFQGPPYSSRGSLYRQNEGESGIIARLRLLTGSRGHTGARSARRSSSRGGNCRSSGYNKGGHHSSHSRGGSQRSKGGHRRDGRRYVGGEGAADLRQQQQQQSGSPQQQHRTTECWGGVEETSAWELEGSDRSSSRGEHPAER